MKIYLLVLFSALSFSVFSQENKKFGVYLDENLKPIDQLDFIEKSLSALYKKTTIENDSLIINKISRKYFFGKFNSLEFNQIKHLISRDLQITDFKQNILFIYKDSLLGYNEFNKSTTNRTNVEQRIKVSEVEHLNRRKRFDRKQKKCLKLIAKKNTIPFYCYSVKDNYSFKSKSYKTKKISNVLKSILFKNESSGITILKPNGNYFYYKYLSQNQVFKMLETNWKNYYSEFYNAKKNLTIKEMPFIKKMNKKRKELFRELTESTIKQRIQKKHRINPYEKEKIIISIPNCFSFVGH